jgi:hypothetical protein
MAGWALAGQAWPDRAGVWHAQQGQRWSGLGAMRLGRRRTVRSEAGRGRGGSVRRLGGSDGARGRWGRERSRRKKGWVGYYTRLCSSGRHISQRP